MDFEPIFESSPLPSLVLLPDAPNFTIAGANQAYLKVTGTSEAIINKPLFEAFPANPDDKAADGVSNLRQSLMQVVKNKALHKMAVQKYDLKRDDGSFEVRYWDPQNSPVFDENGNIIYILHTVVDVTDRIHSQTERSKLKSDLSLKNEQYASLFNHNPDAVFAIDLEGRLVSTNAKTIINDVNDMVVVLHAKNPGDIAAARVTFVNAAFTEKTGYSPEQVLGKPFGMLLGPKTDHQALDNMSRQMREFRHFEGELLQYTKDNREMWVNMSVSPVTDDEGQLSHFVSVQKDVTHKKRKQLQKDLLADIKEIFSHDSSLSSTLQKVMEKVVEFGDFHLAEAWLVDVSLEKLILTSSFLSDQQVESFIRATKDIRQLGKGQGLQGKVWETGKSLLWDNIDSRPEFVRNKAAAEAGLKSAYGIPLIFHQKVIGVLMLTTKENIQHDISLAAFFETFGAHFGAEITRKQIQQDLSRIFNVTADIICLAGFDGYFKKVNPTMSKLLEYTEDELLKTPIMDVTHPDDRRPTAEELQRLIDGHPTHNFENRYLTKTGKVKWLEWTATPVVEEGLIYGVARDVTERKQLKELLDKASNLARIGSWEIDLENSSMYWSPITKEIHEVAPDFVPNIEAAINFYKMGESRENITRAVNEAIKNRTPWDMELQLVTAKGNNRWVRAIGEAEFVNGKCVRIYGSFQDIHRRKEMEIGMNRALLEKNTILESIDDGFFTLDKKWTVLYWNKAAEEMLHLPKEAIVGNYLWDLFPDHVESPSFFNYKRVIDENVAVHFEDYVKPIDKWFEVSAYPSPSGLTGYFRDVTDRKRSEAQLSELNHNLRKHADELAASNAELEQFAYVASHDLQEPLRMITGFLTQLEKKYADQLDDKARTYIGFATDGAKRMRQIILDLLEFSRVGRIQGGIEEVDVNQLLSEIKDVFSKKLEVTGGSLTWGKMPVLKTVKTPLIQVFQNLIANSLKYHKAGVPPTIEVAADQYDSHWQFSVKDNGLGISPEYFQKIFVIFQRLHNKDEYSGTGMGLSICKKIIEHLGGRIWVESEEGRGSTFFFTLPKNVPLS